MSELGPISQAILDHVNSAFGYIVFFRMIHEVARVTGASHTDNWYFRRLVALALEDRIEAKVYRTGDDVAIRFRRLRDAEEVGESGCVCVRSRVVNRVWGYTPIPPPPQQQKHTHPQTHTLSRR